MATFQAVFAPSSPVTGTTYFTGTLGAAGNVNIVLGYRAIFAVTVSADSNIRFGNATKVPTAAATDWPIWAKSVQEWETGEEFDRINLFSTAGGTYFVYVISRT